MCHLSFKHKGKTLNYPSNCSKSINRNKTQYNSVLVNEKEGNILNFDDNKKKSIL